MIIFTCFSRTGCKLLYKHDYAKQHGGQCRVCAFCYNVTHKTVQNHFGGKLEEFCSEECMSLYTVLFYEVRAAYCDVYGVLTRAIVVMLDVYTVIWTCICC